MSSKLKNNGKGTVNIEQIHDFLFFVFMCAASAHQTGEGINFFIIRGTFVLYIGVVIYSFILKKYWHFTGFVMWYIVFVFYSYMTLWWAPSQNAIDAYLGTFIQAFGIIVGLSNRVKNSEDVLKMLRYVVYSIYYLGIVLLITTPLDELGMQERLGGAVGLHSNEIGFRLSVAALLSLYFLVTFKKKKYLFLAGLIFCSALTIMTGTRQALAIIILGFILYASFGTLRASKYKLYRRIVNLFLIGILLGILWWLVFHNDYLYSIMGSRLQAMFESFTGANTDTSMNNRAILRRDAFELFKQNPIFGYGLNCFVIYSKMIHSIQITYSHNNYLELLSTTGIVGFSIFYSMFVYLIVNLFKVSKDSEHYHLKSIFLIFMVMLIIVSYWSVNFQNEFIYAVLLLIYLYVKNEKARIRS